MLLLRILLLLNFVAVCIMKIDDLSRAIKSALSLSSRCLLTYNSCLKQDALGGHLLMIYISA